MRPTISKPQPSPAMPLSSSGRTSPASIKSTRSSEAGGLGGPRSIAGPSNIHQHAGSPQRPPRPKDDEAGVLQESIAEQKVVSLPSVAPLRISTTTTLTRNLSIASSNLVLPFSSRRRPSIPSEDFPSTPTDDEWEDFVFEERLGPSSPTSPIRSPTLRRKHSAPLSPKSPRLTKGASLSRSHASRRSRKNRHGMMPNPRFESVYSTYSYYSPSQLDFTLNDEDQDTLAPATMIDPAVTEADEFGQVPGGANLVPRGSVSSVTTVRPPSAQSQSQQNHTRLGGLRDKFRWLPGRGSGSGPDSSSDESTRPRTSSDASSIKTAETRSASRPSLTRSGSHKSSSTNGRPAIFSKPGFRSLRGGGSSRSGHGYKSSTDSSSYAPSLSSFEQNLQIGGTGGSSSCGDDDASSFKARPWSPSQASSIVVVDEPKNITGPPVPSHVRSRSHNFHYPNLRNVRSFESIRAPRLRDRNDVPHHPFAPSIVPYPLAYSHAMAEADRWNHALLFGDERNPANAGGLLRGSTISFSQFYGVGSGRKEILKGKELRGGKVLDIGCGEGLWVLSAAREWKHTRFVGFDLMPVQMNLQERLLGVKNASDIIDRIEWVNGDCLNASLPFDDNSFDLVRLANMTLALPTDPEADNWRLRALFSEIFRVLKVDGELEVIDENHTVPSASLASPSHPEHAAFDAVNGPHINDLELAFQNMLTYTRLSAYPIIPELLKQHFSTSTEKGHFRLAVAPDLNAVDQLARRGSGRDEIDSDLGFKDGSTHSRAPSSSVPTGRNRKMLQLLGEEFAESRKSTRPTGLIVLPNKMLPLSPAAVYAHATHSTSVMAAAKESLFDFVELCAQGRGTPDRKEFDDLIWQYESSRFDRLGLRDPLQTWNDWDTGLSDANEGLWSHEIRSPRYCSTMTPPESVGVGSMGPLPAWRYESDSDVITVREIRVCLARKTSLEAPAYNPPAGMPTQD